MTVFSFVATSNGGIVSNFSGDAKTFLTYLTTNQGMPTSQYVNGKSPICPLLWPLPCGL